MGIELRRTAANPDLAMGGPLCQVSLIDIRTGHPLRLNGAVVSVQTRHPQHAAAQLLEGRDASLWQLRINPLETRGKS